MNGLKRTLRKQFVCFSIQSLKNLMNLEFNSLLTDETRLENGDYINDQVHLIMCCWFTGPYETDRLSLQPDT